MPQFASQWRSDVALALAGLAALLLLGITLVSGRPVNDDYWAIESLTSDGFLGSLAWYYTEFQGNVISWLFILLHELPWISGVSPWASAASVGLTFVILAGGCWGGLVFLGIRWPSGWRFGAALTVVTVITWLSLASLVSPNAMTLVFYMPSTIVHVWPWCFALLAFGLCLRQETSPLGPLGWLGTGMLGVLVGSLGLVEAFVIACSTFIAGVFAWRRAAEIQIRRSLGWAWLLGLGAGLAVQVASPATWGRGGGLGTDAALSTNIEAVNRILAQVGAVAGPSFGQSLLSILDVEIWARLLVPVAVAGDLFLRLGLIAAFLLALGWAVCRPGDFRLSHPTLRNRLLLLALVTVVGALTYSASGALYAYAGRHVAGLALVATVLVVGLGVLGSAWWARHERLLAVGVLASLVVVLGLAAQQVRFGWTRAEAWDQALAINKVLIMEGRIEDLVDVPLKAGISQSGLRDHDRSGAYIEWVSRQGTS